MIIHFLLTNFSLNFSLQAESLQSIGDQEIVTRLQSYPEISVTLELESLSEISQIDAKLFDSHFLDPFSFKLIAIYNNVSKEEVDGYLSLIVLPDAEYIKINKNLIILNAPLSVEGITTIYEDNFKFQKYRIQGRLRNLQDGKIFNIVNPRPSFIFQACRNMAIKFPI